MLNPVVGIIMHMDIVKLIGRDGGPMVIQELALLVVCPLVGSCIKTAIG